MFNYYVNLLCVFNYNINAMCNGLVYSTSLVGFNGYLLLLRFCVSYIIICYSIQTTHFIIVIL